jgi:hypothetical protein
MCAYRRHTSRAIILTPADAAVFAQLAAYVRDLMPFPGVDVMAAQMGYGEGGGGLVRQSLHRLAAEGFIRLEGGSRQISAIVLVNSAARLVARRRGNTPKPGTQ